MEANEAEGRGHTNRGSYHGREHEEQQGVRRGFLMRWDRRVDHRKNRRVVDFLDPRRLVLTAERQIEFLLQLDPPA